MENLSLTEICRLLASCCVVMISTPIMGRIRASSSREVPGVRPMILSMGVRLQTCPLVLFIALVNEREPSGLCMCPFYCGQVMDRYACSGSSCLNPLYDMFMTHLWKEENLRQFTSQTFMGGNKNVFLKTFHTWESLTCDMPTCSSKISIFEYFGCATFLTCTTTPVIMRQKGTWSHLFLTWSDMFL